MTLPKYLRAVVTTACPMACTYCHMEGDPPVGVSGGAVQRGNLTTDEWVAILEVAVQSGVRKVKFLGGEPLSRSDLPEIIRRVRAIDREVDLSVITSGVASVERLDACFAAGLTRANMSVHGWEAEAFARRNGNARMRLLRDRSLERLLQHGRCLKLNYVYGGPADVADLTQFLNWCAGKPVVANVLDDLGSDVGPRGVEAIVRELRGPPDQTWVDPDPYSLPTRHLRWSDGLQVEIKDQHLGELEPWNACATCPVRRRCKEGIHAVRVSHDGALRPCMDRPDLGFDLARPLREGGRTRLVTAWDGALSSLVTPVALSSSAEVSGPGCQNPRNAGVSAST